MRCGTPVLFAASPSRMAPTRNHGVSLMKPEKAVSNLATPRDQNSTQPISPVAPYSITFVIHATIMKLEIAIAPFAAGGIAKGENQIAKGTSTQSAAKTIRSESERSAITSEGWVATVTSLAVIGFSAVSSQAT